MKASKTHTSQRKSHEEVNEEVNEEATKKSTKKQRRSQRRSNEEATNLLLSIITNSRPIPARTVMGPTGNYRLIVASLTLSRVVIRCVLFSVYDDLWLLHTYGS